MQWRCVLKGEIHSRRRSSSTYHPGCYALWKEGEEGLTPPGGATPDSTPASSLQARTHTSTCTHQHPAQFVKAPPSFYGIAQFSWRMRRPSWRVSRLASGVSRKKDLRSLDLHILTPGHHRRTHGLCWLESTPCELQTAADLPWSTRKQGQMLSTVWTLEARRRLTRLYTQLSSCSC